ncbi:hypothetical protein KCU93_g297, partial [Aureobasidium melanogenum]
MAVFWLIFFLSYVKFTQILQVPCIFGKDKVLQWMRYVKWFQKEVRDWLKKWRESVGTKTASDYASESKKAKWNGGKDAIAQTRMTALLKHVSHRCCMHCYHKSKEEVY